MNTYSIALFLHIAGALGFFIVQGVEWIGLLQVRTAALPEEAHAVLGVLKRSNGLGVASMLMIFISGFYMVLTVWHFVPWILVVLGALVVEIILFVALTRPRLAAIEHALRTEKWPLSPTFHHLVSHPILWISIQTRTAILLGIVFLKVVTPDLRVSLLVIGVAIVLGLASALPVLRHQRVQTGSAARIIIAFIIPASAVTLLLLAANSIPASTIPLSRTKSDVQGAQTKRSEVSTEVGASNLSTQAPASSPEMALQEGPLLLQTRCTQCHSLEKVLQVKKTRAEWEETLSKMESFNVKVSDSEKEALLDYLTIVENP